MTLSGFSQRGSQMYKILKMSGNKYPILAIPRKCKIYRLVIRMVRLYYASVIKVASNSCHTVRIHYKCYKMNVQRLLKVLFWWETSEKLEKLLRDLGCSVFVLNLMFGSVFLSQRTAAVVFREEHTGEQALCGLW